MKVMKRNLSRLTTEKYDVLVLGGGIFGSCIAWDAASRGLKVALIDKGDFGHLTSANSMRTIHGGLRYLQYADFKLVRNMIIERRIWQRIAPHLVRPIRLVIPTYRDLRQNKWLMRAGLMAYQLLALDGNQGLEPAMRFPRNNLISKSETLSQIPGLNPKGVTGGMVWYDAQVQNSERLTLGFVSAAVGAGAEGANYLEAIQYLRNTGGIFGVRARDVLSSSELDIRAKITVNSLGAWTDNALGQLDGYQAEPKFNISIAFNLVADQILSDHGVGFPSVNDQGRSETGQKGDSQTLFIIPWRNYSLLGTKHLHYHGDLKDFEFPETEAKNFLEDIKRSYSGLDLDYEDIHFIHQGYLPAVGKESKTGVKLVFSDQIHDHQKDGIRGLVTVVGTKYTTARRVAENVVDLLFRKLDSNPPPCITRYTPIAGGDYESYDHLLAQARFEAPAGLPEGSIEHLVGCYGTQYRQLYADINDSPQLAQVITDNSPVVSAEIVHAVRREMAQTAADIIQRRTELWMYPSLSADSIQSVNKIMSAEFEPPPLR